MIKFFRAIRQNLLNEGKTAKYLKYAIGEIVLVVIGILIALQINNWNQDIQQRQKEKKILIELKRDLVSNDSILQQEIEFHENMLEGATIAIEHLKSKKPFNDTIGRYLSGLSKVERIQFVSSAYESLKSIGIDIISSDPLRKEIANLFGNSFPSVTNFIRDVGIQTKDLYLPLHQRFFEVLITDNSIQNLRLVPDYDNLLKSQEFINALSRKKAIKLAVVITLKQLQDSVRKTISDIDNELETFD